MNRSVILALTLLAGILGINAWCFPWSVGETIILCKGPGKNNCTYIQNYDKCSVIIGNYTLGFTSGGHECEIYKDVLCHDGDLTHRLYGGVIYFETPPKAFRCQCN